MNSLKLFNYAKTTYMYIQYCITIQSGGFSTKSHRPQAEKESWWVIIIRMLINSRTKLIEPHVNIINCIQIVVVNIIITRKMITLSEKSGWGLQFPTLEPPDVKNMVYRSELDWL